MTVNQKPTGIAATVPAGLAWGAFAASSITLAGAGITAILIDREILSWEQSGYAVLIILLLASWLGASASAGKIKRQRLMICIASGAVYFSMLLLITALFFGGHYSGVGETALLIFCGSMLGVFTGYRGKSGKIRRISGKRNR